MKTAFYSVALSYLAYAFLHADFNPFDWEMIDRGMLMITTIFIFIIFDMIKNARKKKK
jgi:hypothetical protein